MLNLALIPHYFDIKKCVIQEWVTRTNVKYVTLGQLHGGETVIVDGEPMMFITCSPDGIYYARKDRSEVCKGGAYIRRDKYEVLQVGEPDVSELLDTRYVVQERANEIAVGTRVIGKHGFGYVVGCKKSYCEVEYDNGIVDKMEFKGTTRVPYLYTYNIENRIVDESEKAETPYGRLKNKLEFLEYRLNSTNEALIKSVDQAELLKQLNEKLDRIEKMLEISQRNS